MIQAIPNEETVDTEELCDTIEKGFETFKDELNLYKESGLIEHWFNAIKTMRDMADSIDKLEIEMQGTMN